MARAPGQIPGQPAAEQPTGFDWGTYLAGLVATHGSLAAVAARLAEQRGYVEQVGTIERGLRRLRDRGHRDGGVWGRRALRGFGLPRDVQARVRWMGQYHTRFTDMPCSLCVELLHLWDRPPVNASPARVWIQLGFVTVALRKRELDTAVEHLDRAGSALAHAEPAAHIEHALVSAYITGRTAPARIGEFLDRAGALLDSAALSPEDRACLFARWIDQRAYELNKPRDGRAPDPAAALALYQSIPTAGAPPFALCRRDNGIGWSKLNLGDRAAALAHARASVEHAGDGGSLRLRAMALNLLARAQRGEHAERARQRGLAIARRLEDEELRVRIQRYR